MEAFVATVKVLSQDKNWNDLKKLVKDSSVLILKNVSKIDSAISALDVNDHCLGHINLMVFKLSLPNVGDFELFFNQIQNIVEHGSQEQIFECIDKYCHIFHLFTKCMIEQQQPFRGIRILMQAIEKGQKHSSELLSIHSDLLQLCLKARCMKPALQYLDVDITSINNEFGEYNCKMFLTYYYYGGMVYLALKKYEKALFFLQMAITTPALGVSRIMLEAYKKYILVSVLLYGKIEALPKYTSPIVGRYLKPLSAAYIELADTYVKYNPEQLRVIATRHQTIYAQDNNVGLVKQLIASVTKRRIQKLTKTFVTLSLADMAARVNVSGVNEAESYLLEMIEEGKIFATIDEQAGIVSFHHNPKINNTPLVLNELQSQMKSCITFNEQLMKMDRELQVSAQYVRRVMSMAQSDDAVKGDEIIC